MAPHKFWLQRPQFAGSAGFGSSKPGTSLRSTSRSLKAHWGLKGSEACQHLACSPGLARELALANVTPTIFNSFRCFALLCFYFSNTSL